MGRRKGKGGHHQGKGYSDVWRDGKAYAYTAWDDNADEVGAEMSLDTWKKAYEGLQESLKANQVKKRKRRKRKSG